MIRIILVCDACGFQYESSRKQAARARAQAARAGWSNPGGVNAGGDFCPAHARDRVDRGGEAASPADVLSEHWIQVRSGHFQRQDGLLLEAGVQMGPCQDSIPVAFWTVGVSDAPAEGPGLDEIYPALVPSDGGDLNLQAGPVGATLLWLDQEFPFRPDTAEGLAKAPRSKVRRIVPS